MLKFRSRFVPRLRIMKSEDGYRCQTENLSSVNREVGLCATLVTGTAAATIGGGLSSLSCWAITAAMSANLHATQTQIAAAITGGG